jgi:hypothetical protein
MLIILLEVTILFLSNFFSLLLIYFNSSLQTQYITMAVLIIGLIFFQKFIFTASNARKVAVIRWLFLFFSSMLVELLVYSTGGFYSSFFVMLHFFALGLGFFLSLKASLFFVFLSALGLLVHLKIDPRLATTLAEDPGSLTLYFMSYFIILPFCYFLAQQFQLKAKLANILEKEVSANKIILGEINELVFITNLDLKILSVNDTVERALMLSRTEIVSKPIFDILYLRTKNNSFVNADHPLIKDFLTQKVQKRLTEINMYAKNNPAPFNVVVDIKPVADLQGTVEQITFIITNTQTTAKTDSSPDTLSIIKSLQIKQQATLEDLKDKLISGKLAHLAGQLYLAKNWGEDSMLLTEIKQINDDKVPSFVDLAQFTSNMVSQNQEFSHLINNTLSYNLAFSSQTKLAPLPPGLNLSAIQMTSPYFSTSISIKWFGILLNKLIFIANLLSVATPQKTVLVQVDLYNESIVRIKIAVSGISLLPEEKKMLFIKGYGTLGSSSHLKFASGLEGIFAQQIAAALNVTLDSEYDNTARTLSLVLYIDKKSKQK